MHYTQPDVYEFIAKQTNDPIVEWKTCRVSGTKFAIYQSDLDFYDRLSPIFSGEKYAIPTPSLCPEERQRRRMGRRNDNIYFKRTCDFSGQAIVTTYHPETPGPVYKVKHWRSDSRDAEDYAQEIDWGKSFFDQYMKLHNTVPKIAMMNDNDLVSENIEYCQNLSYSKNCYLTTVSWKLSNCYYSCNMATGDWLMDSYFTMDSQVCYECVESHKLHNCFYLMNCHSCTNCWFGYELHGCSDCLFCVGLENKKYYFLNKELTKAEYYKKISEIKERNLVNPEGVQKLWEDFLAGFPRKNMNLVSTERTFGNNNMNTEHATFCFNVKNLKNCKYFMFSDTGTDGYDLTVGGELELCYEGITPDHCYKAGFINYCRKSSDIRYCEMCHSCKDCFGCIGLKGKQYCIFNKQYTREEYEALVPKLIDKMKVEGVWGEFFSINNSPFAYNHTVAQDYFPEDQESAVALGASRRDDEENTTKEGANIIKASNLLRDPRLINDDVVGKVIQCEVSGKPFRLMPNELEFYRKYMIPLPTKHPLVRYRERLEKMPNKQLYLRTCDKTGEEIISTHPQNTSYKVYSEEAFTGVIQ